MGAFATHPIKAGTIVLREEPLFIISKPWDRITEADVCDEYRKLSSQDQATFDNLRDSKVNSATSLLRHPSPHKVADMQCPACQRTRRPHIITHRLTHDQAELGENPQKKKIYQFFANKFAVGRQPSYGCFAVSSRFNHSCLPNSAITAAEGKPTFKVFQDVEQGQELTFAYVDSLQYMHTAQRQSELKRINVHHCKCKLCCSPPVERVVSDMRRGLLRALLFMVRGQDLAFGRPMVDHLTEDVYLEDATLHWLIIAMLAEAEGLVAGDVPYNAYANAARLLLCQSVHKENESLDRSLIRNARTWMDKSESLLRRFSIAPLESSIEWMALRRFVDAVGPDGKIPPIGSSLRNIVSLPAGMKSKKV